MLPSISVAYLQGRTLQASDRLLSLYSSLSRLPLPSEIDIALARELLSRHWLCSCICAAVISVITLYAISSRRSRSRARRAPESRQLLQALLYILTPTCSLWPASYVKLVQRAVAARRTTLRLPLGTLVDDILSGRIELRHPKLDLPGLLRDGLRVEDWTFGLSVERALWADVLGWLFSAQLSPPKSRGSLSAMVPESFSVNWHASEKHSYTGFEPPSANVELKKTPLLPSVVSAALPPAISLDGVAYTLMESSVKELQASLVPGTSLTLVFTTPGTTASFPSNNFVLAALPFLPRSGFKQTSQKQVHPTNQHGPWAPAPLFSSLPQILQLLTAGPNPLVVNSIVNISEAYASSLHAYVHALEEDRVATERFVQQHGVAHWRGERFFASWEAACLTNKLLERWAVVVRR